MTAELYQRITCYGDLYKLKPVFKNPNNFVDFTENNFDYVAYNPRKPIKREGLSITSLDGGLSGRPDLDSIFEYNKEHGTHYDETDFNVPTPVYDFPDVKHCLDPLKNNICRTHVLKLGPGEYFPPHRDIAWDYFKTFRLIIPLKNMRPPDLNFVLDGTILDWEIGSMYFVNTAKMHYVFNTFIKPSYMIVVNVILNQESIDFVSHNLRFS